MTDAVAIALIGIVGITITSVPATIAAVSARGAQKAARENTEKLKSVETKVDGHSEVQVAETKQLRLELAAALSRLRDEREKTSFAAGQKEEKEHHQ